MIAAGLLTLVGTVIGELVTDWRQGRQNKRQVKQAVTENRIRLAQSKTSHNQAWEMAALEGGDKWLRRVSFFMLSFPLVWAGFDSESARSYFTDALGVLPDWYIVAYVGVLGAIWGLSELKQFRG